MASKWARSPSSPWAGTALVAPGDSITICSAVPGLSLTHSCTNRTLRLLRPACKRLGKNRREAAPHHPKSIPTLLAHAWNQTLWRMGHPSADRVSQSVLQWFGVSIPSFDGGQDGDKCLQVCRQGKGGEKAENCPRAGFHLHVFTVA